MKYLTIVLVLCLLSCEKDSHSSCPFLGKWCIEDQSNMGTCDPINGYGWEFRENGEYFQAGLAGKHWVSSDCETIEIFDDATNTKAYEWKVIDVTYDYLILEAQIGSILRIKFLRDE